MFLIVHASAGAIIGETLNQPLGAVFLGWLSHYVLDAIPHGDQIIGRIYKSAKSYGMLKILFVLDFTVAFSLLFWLWLKGALINPEMAMLAATAAVLPDILQGIYSISGQKILTAHARWHAWNHQLSGRTVSPLIGFIIQFSTLSLIWFFNLKLLEIL